MGRKDTADCHGRYSRDVGHMDGRDEGGREIRHVAAKIKTRFSLLTESNLSN